MLEVLVKGCPYLCRKEAKVAVFFGGHSHRLTWSLSSCWASTVHRSLPGCYCNLSIHPDFCLVDMPANVTLIYTQIHCTYLPALAFTCSRVARSSIWMQAYVSIFSMRGNVTHWYCPPVGYWVGIEAVYPSTDHQQRSLHEIYSTLQAWDFRRGRWQLH